MQAPTKVLQSVATGASGDTVTVLAFVNDIASTSKEVIMNAYHGLDDSVSKILLDFKGVEYVNSSGIAIIIQLLLEASKAPNQKISIANLTPHFVKVFTMVGVGKYATIFPDQAAALAAL